MNPPDEFLKHAADCEQMAKFARDAESKATWYRMAERWRRCVEKFTTESLAAHHAMLAKRRQVSPLIGPITEAYSRGDPGRSCIRTGGLTRRATDGVKWDTHNALVTRP